MQGRNLSGPPLRGGFLLCFAGPERPRTRVPEVHLQLERSHLWPLALNTDRCIEGLGDFDLYIESKVLQFAAVPKIPEEQARAPLLLPTRKSACGGKANGVVLPVEACTV